MAAKDKKIYIHIEDEDGDHHFCPVGAFNKNAENWDENLKGCEDEAGIRTTGHVLVQSYINLNGKRR